MFVCDDCLDTVYIKVPYFGGSYGKCESCGKEAGCADIHHSRLFFSRKWAEENMEPDHFAYLDREGIIGKEGT